MSAWLYVFFLLFVAFMLFLDLKVFHRKAKEISVREALLWTLFWVSLAMLFLPVVYMLYDNNWFGVGTQPDPIQKQILSPLQACKTFLAGYLVEESLSLDNIFVIAVVLSFFGVPGKYQHRVLFWGILGAVVLRGIMIGIGSVLVKEFWWVTFIFGGILLFTAWKMLTSGEEEVDLEKNAGVRLARRFIPLTPTMHGERFFVIKDGKRYATPLFLALVVIESLDVVFAIDSIPAIFSMTGDPFLVFTSNIFAILGLRSLYFALAALLRVFHYLKYSLVALLAFLGVKMLISPYLHAHGHHIPIGVSLGAIVGILCCGVIASLIVKPKEAIEVPEAAEEAADEQMIATEEK